MSDPLIWAIVCFALAIVLFFMEVFVPSGGILGLLAGAALIAGIILVFQIDTTLGLIATLVCMAAVPFFAVIAIKMWPHTVIGRMLTLNEGHEPSLQDRVARSSRPKVGMVGKAVTKLTPIGTCQFEGVRCDCMSERGVIERGQEVEVISSMGMEIKVRARSQTDSTKA